MKSEGGFCDPFGQIAPEKVTLWDGLCPGLFFNLLYVAF
jgi:hypothetical protein